MLRVILVDDDPEINWFVGRYLTRAGHTVNTCNDGSDAILLMKEKEFDFLITDIQMPRLNGFAVIEWVRQNRPHMRVAVMTGFGSPMIREMSLSKGALVYLEKPLDPELLLEVLDSPVNARTFSGNVSGIELFDYVQLMMLTHRKVVLEVSSRQERKGTLFIEKGNAIHAVCGDVEGEEAFYDCLAFEGGSFCTLPWCDPPQRSIDTPGEFLLMEAARKKDENSFLKEGETAKESLGFDSMDFLDGLEKFTGEELEPRE